MFRDAKRCRRDPNAPPDVKMCAHCAITPASVVLAALRYKVAEIVEARRRELPADTVFAEALAEDRRVAGTGGESRANAVDRDHLTKKLPGFPERIQLHRGMRALLTVNQCQRTGFINGNVGTVVDWAVENGAVKTVSFRVDGAAAPIVVRRRRSFEQKLGGTQLVRYQFPLLSSNAVTVHRVQGCTIESDLHILLNSEFFAPGQAYVALTRTRRRDQIHLWDLDYDALVADPEVAAEYEQLRTLRLTRALVAAARARVRTRVLPLDNPST